MVLIGIVIIALMKRVQTILQVKRLSTEIMFPVPHIKPMNFLKRFQAVEYLNRERPTMQ